MHAGVYLCGYLQLTYRGFGAPASALPLNPPLAPLTRNGSSLPAVLLEGGPPAASGPSTGGEITGGEAGVGGPRQGLKQGPPGRERKAFVRETGQSERGKETQEVARASICLFLHIPGVIAKANLDWLRPHTL